MNSLYSLGLFIRWWRFSDETYHKELLHVTTEMLIDVNECLLCVIKTHHYIIFFVRPLHSKPGTVSGLRSASTFFTAKNVAEYHRNK